MSHRSAAADKPPPAVYLTPFYLPDVKLDKPVLAMAWRKLRPEYHERELWMLANDCSVCSPRPKEPCQWTQLAMPPPATEDSTGGGIEMHESVFVVRLVDFFVSTTTTLPAAPCFIVVCLAFEITGTEYSCGTLKTHYASGHLMLSFYENGSSCKREWLVNTEDVLFTQHDETRQLGSLVLTAQRYASRRAAFALQEGIHGPRLLTAAPVGAKIIVTSRHIVSRGLDHGGTSSVNVAKKLQLTIAGGEIERNDFAVEAIHALPDGTMALCLLVESRSAPGSVMSHADTQRVVPLLCALPLGTRMQDTRPVFRVLGTGPGSPAGLVPHWKTRPPGSRWRISDDAIMDAYLWNTTSLLGAPPYGQQPWWRTDMMFKCVLAHERESLVVVCRMHGLELVIIDVDAPSERTRSRVDATVKLRHTRGFNMPDLRIQQAYMTNPEPAVPALVPAGSRAAAADAATVPAGSRLSDEMASLSRLRSSQSSNRVRAIDEGGPPF